MKMEKIKRLTNSNIQTAYFTECRRVLNVEGNRIHVYAHIRSTWKEVFETFFSLCFGCFSFPFFLPFSDMVRTK